MLKKAQMPVSIAILAQEQNGLHSKGEYVGMNVGMGLMWVYTHGEMCERARVHICSPFVGIASGQNSKLNSKIKINK